MRTSRARTASVISPSDPDFSPGATKLSLDTRGTGLGEPQCSNDRVEKITAENELGEIVRAMTGSSQPLPPSSFQKV